MNSFERITDETPMPWGKYKGENIEDVPASYLLWLEDNIKSKPSNDKFRNGLLVYIEDNRFGLTAELNSKR